MSLCIAFWVLMLLWAVLGAAMAPRTWPALGTALLPFLAVFCLGWATFGPPIHG